jgi:hypothetical protein
LAGAQTLHGAQQNAPEESAPTEATRRANVKRSGDVAANAAPAAPQIPIPAPDARPSTPLWPRVLERAFDSGFLSQEEYDGLASLPDEYRVDAALQLLAAIADVDKRRGGAQQPHVRAATFDPKPYGDNFNPSPLRSDFFDLFLDDGRDLPACHEAIRHGLKYGFSLCRDGGPAGAVTWPSAAPRTDAVALEMDKAAQDEVDAGRAMPIAEMTELGKSFVRDPVVAPRFAVPKTDEQGNETGVRICSHFSLGSDEFPSLNDGIASVDTNIQYEGTDKFQELLCQAEADNVATAEAAARAEAARAAAARAAAAADEDAAYDRAAQKFMADFEAYEAANPYQPPALGKADVLGAYRLIPIRPEDWRFLVFLGTGGMLFADIFLPFGVASACRCGKTNPTRLLRNHNCRAVLTLSCSSFSFFPRHSIFSLIGLTLTYVLRHCFGLRIVNYLDDFACISATVEGSVQEVLLITRFLDLMGAKHKVSKTQSGFLIIIFLGLQYDSRKMTVAIPEGKVTALISALSEWVFKGTATKREVQRLCGSLAWCARVVSPGRMFLNRVFAYLRAFYKTGVSDYMRLPVPEDVRLDLRFWLAFFPVFNGKLSIRPPPSITDEVWSDASDRAGGAVWRNFAVRVEWRDALAYLDRDHTDIGPRETYALALACAQWAVQWSGRRVLFHCDNKGNVYAFDKWRCRSTHTLLLMRFVALFAAIYRFSFRVDWIATADNQVADLITRVSIEEFMRRTQGQFTLEPVRLFPPAPSDGDWEVQLCRRLKDELGVE